MLRHQRPRLNNLPKKERPFSKGRGHLQVMPVAIVQFGCVRNFHTSDSLRGTYASQWGNLRMSFD